MNSTADETEKLHVAKGNFPLWVGMLLPPMVWSTQLETLYLTSEYGCFSNDFLWNHVVSVIAIVVSLTGTFVAWRHWHSGRSDETGEMVPSRKQFMALLGILTGSLFTLVIIAQWLPTLMGVPCDK